MLKLGNLAPNFWLMGEDGSEYTLKQFLGRPVVLFFYSKDLTPGCSKECLDFDQIYDQIKDFGAQLFGISRDNLASHARFKSKLGLRYNLLSDPDLLVHSAFGATDEKIVKGVSTKSVSRTTVLIEQNGKVAKIWSRVRIKGHAKAVLDALAKLDNEEEQLFSSTIFSR